MLRVHDNLVDTYKTTLWLVQKVHYGIWLVSLLNMIFTQE